MKPINLSLMLTMAAASWIAVTGPAALGTQAIADEQPVESRGDAVAKASESATDSASWEMPRIDAVRRATLEYVASRQPSADVLKQAEATWPADARVSHQAVVERAVRVLALVEPKAKELLTYSLSGVEATTPHAAWLVDAATPEVVRNPLRLLVARRLVELRRFDDALELLAGLEVDDVSDPASLLFYRAVAQHALVRPNECAENVALLLEHADAIPVRYAAVAKLMRADIEGVKDGSLDHIARRMDDLQRRMNIGQAGPRVNDLADGVVKSLDELIKKGEEQRQQQQMASQGAAPSSGKPAQESRPFEGKGEGKVEHKHIGSGRDWGNLPAKAREEALQQIGKDFPAHYREIIEEYFRRLAAEEDR